MVKLKRKPVAQTGKDLHHLLYQRRHWKQGYAKRLRDNEYFKVYIPMATLHRQIHSKIHDIPTPNGKDCRRAYNRLTAGLHTGKLDPKHDTIEKRLDFLIEVWEETCPATVAILKWQREVIHKFFEGAK